MYNRYIPQPDGSYRKNQFPDPSRPRPPEKQPEKQPEPECDFPPPPPKHYQEAPCATFPCQSGQRAGDFLRRLLPKNLDTGDLLVIILLLLMAGDSKEDSSTALLTLALYLFL